MLEFDSITIYIHIFFTAGKPKGICTKLGDRVSFNLTLLSNIVQSIKLNDAIVNGC